MGGGGGRRDLVLLSKKDNTTSGGGSQNMSKGDLGEGGVWLIKLPKDEVIS